MPLAVSFGQDIAKNKEVVCLADTFGLSDVGCVRELNEDSFCIHGFKENDGNGFCVLADGMGGHNAGEVASQNAVKLIAEDLQRLSAEDEIPKKINEAIVSANQRIYKMSCENSIHSGMGTTVVATYITERNAYIANVGDSRAYAIRGDEIVQITTDHSVVSELLMSGMITYEEARNHPQRNIITRAVGTEEDVKVDVFEYNFSAGDILLMCSDGLSTMLEDNEILRIVTAEETAENTVNKLIEAAKDKGGIDNITAICIRF